MQFTDNQIPVQESPPDFSPSVNGQSNQGVSTDKQTTRTVQIDQGTDLNGEWEHVKADQDTSKKKAESDPSHKWDTGQMGQQDDNTPTGFSDEVFADLPPSLQKACGKFTTEDERATYLVGAIGTLSGLLPNVEGIYDGRPVGPQTYVFVVAPFGVGKGALEYTRQLALPVHQSKRELYEAEKKEHQLRQHHYEQELQAFKKQKDQGAQPPSPPNRVVNRMLFIPANSSKTAIMQAIAENEGRGIIFENEGDTLADAVRQDYGNFSDVLRKAFHHEPINLLRRGNEGEYIEVMRPRLSLIISSTFGQLLNLIPNAENGLFSRFIFYRLSPNPIFKNVFDRRKSDYGVYFTEQGEYYQQLHDLLQKRSEEDPIRFALSLEQQTQFVPFFQALKDETGENVSQDFAGSINRLGLICFRLCMVLSVLRAYDDSPQNIPRYLICKPIDFTNALRIVRTLKLHALSIYWQLPKSRIKSADEENDETKLDQKRRCREMHKQGRSYRDIAEAVLGSASKKQTSLPMVPTITPVPKENCPKHGTRDKWDTPVTDPVPFVPRPTNETAIVSKSILDVEVSCFADYKSPDNPRTVNLLKWLTSAKYRSAVELIRSATDKKERDRIKATLPAITPSGEFTRREASALIAHSGLICLDIDLKGNEGIANYDALKEQLCRIPNVAYCGRSVSGTGYFVLIPITNPAQHGNQFRALREIFQKRFGVRIDDTPDVSRLRGYSYDAEAYFNHQATPFSGIYEDRPIAPRNDRPVYNFKLDKFGDVALRRCIQLIEDAQDGQKHAQLNKAAYTAGGYVAGGVLDEAVAITALEDAISRKANVADMRAASRTIRDGIRDGQTRADHPGFGLFCPNRGTRDKWDIDIN